MSTTLPIDPLAFRALVRSARREPQRDELLQRIQGEAGSRPSGAARRLYETRLLEFTRVPAVSKEFGWDLAVSHNEAWNALVGMRSAQLARHLRALGSGRDAKLAAEATKHLAWLAFESDLPRLIRNIETGDWPMRGAIAYGAQLAARHKHASKTFRRRVFNTLAPLACGEAPIPRTNAAEEMLSDIIEALPALDRTAGYKLLTSNRAIRPANPAIRQVMLRLFFDRDESPRPFRSGIDPDLLWPVYESLRKRKPKLAKGYTSDPDAPYEQTMGLILHLAADRDPIGTARECKAIRSDKRLKKDSALRAEAAAALKRCQGVPAPDEVLQHFYRQPKKFGPSATKVIRAYELFEHFLSDGLPLYFGNLGEHWRSASAGLAAVGAGPAAAIVRSGAAIARKFGSLRDCKSASDAFAAMDDAALRRLEALDDQFERESDRILAAIERYIARQPEDFGGRS